MRHVKRRSHSCHEAWGRRPQPAWGAQVILLCDRRFERLDGSVSNQERSVRIDRFNKNPDVFCFLLSTRAGGLGINLASADTVIIFDSDWNPHADLQATARAHRIGQKNKVMIYRLVTRNTVEERVMQRAKKKMMLEQIVVRKMHSKDKSSATFKKGELDNILRYGAADMFKDTATEGEVDSVIEYDDEALAALLDRSREEVEDDTEGQDKDSGWLSSFKVANYDLVKKKEDEDDEARGGGFKEMEVDDDDDAINNQDYWDTLLGSSYTEHMGTLGKGKRDRKQVNPNLYKDLYDPHSSTYAGGDEDANGSEHEEEDEAGGQPKKRKVDPSIMDARGRICGFSTRERKVFKEIFYRRGLWRFRWEDFQQHPSLRHKSLEEVAAYGSMFLQHIQEELPVDFEAFSDGVPREKLDVKLALSHAASNYLVQQKLEVL